jgi:hypothetical protein
MVCRRSWLVSALFSTLPCLAVPPATPAQALPVTPAQAPPAKPAQGLAVQPVQAAQPEPTALTQGGEAQHVALLRDMLQEKAAFWKQAQGLFMISNNTKATCTLTFTALAGKVDLLRFDPATRLFVPIPGRKMVPGSGIRLTPDEFTVLQFDGKPGNPDCKATLSLQLSGNGPKVPIAIYGKGGDRNRFFWKFQNPADEAKSGRVFQGVPSDEPDADGGNTSSIVVNWEFDVQE